MNIKLINPQIQYDDYLTQIFINRDVDAEFADKFAKPSEDDIISYKKLKNIDKALECLYRHLQDKILIQVDSDVDGYTSSALLYNYLKTEFPNISLDYQVHDDKSHGLDITQDILDKKYDLIIIPDASSGEIDKHKQVHDLGIDLIILDHHLCDNEDEYSILVNNQTSPEYENKGLTGAGVVWQFCRAIYNEFDNIKTNPDKFIDLAAVGMCGDMADFTDLETRAIILKGFETIFKDEGSNLFIRSLKDKQKYYFQNGIDYHGMSFYIVPLINSVVRSGTIEERIKTFEAFLNNKCLEEIPSTKRGCKGQYETLLVQMTRSLTNIKKRQDESVKEAMIQAEKVLTKEYIDNNSILIYIIDKGTINKNLNGLLANKICGQYKKPTMVLQKHYENDIPVYTGSFRAPGDSRCEDFREFIRESNLAEYAEGHPCAGGTCFIGAAIDNFIEYANFKLSSYLEEYVEEYYVDLVFHREIPTDVIETIYNLKEYWGRGIEEPVILLTELKVTKDNKTLLTKGPTVKIKTPNGEEIMFFKSSLEFFESIAPTDGSATYINVIGTCSVNNWNGKITYQFIANDYEIINTIYDF